MAFRDGCRVMFFVRVNQVLVRRWTCLGRDCLTGKCVGRFPAWLPATGRRRSAALGLDRREPV